MNRSQNLCFAFIAYCVAAATSAQASIHNVVSDFSGAANPNGPYSYGYYSGLTFQKTVLSSNGSDFSAHHNSNGPYITWTAFDRPSWLSGYWPSNVLLFDPSLSGLYTVLRFSAPAADAYGIAGYFLGLDTATTSVSVIANAFTPDQSVLFSDFINGRGNVKAFSTSQYLNQGATLDFVVGSNGNVYFDATGLAATITSQSSAVPIPSTHLLFGSAIIGLFGFKWKPGKGPGSSSFPEKGIRA